jgi:uncharacterized repeat protein (TIGR03803 family)
MMSGFRRLCASTVVPPRWRAAATVVLSALSPLAGHGQDLPKATILRFSGSNGANPYGGFVEDKTGHLYGTTASGGSGDGVVFELMPTSDPEGTRKIEVLHEFLGNDDGNDPLSSLALFKGNLYGTTFVGGSGSNGCYADGLGCGTVFELVAPSGTEKKWTYSVLYRFSSVESDNDGAMPGGYGNGGGVYVDDSGTIYGTTSQGGGTSCTAPGEGCGVFYEISPGGGYSILYRFQGGSDANAPSGTLIPGPGGMLYGTSEFGGNTGSSCIWGSLGCGTVFALSPSGSETVIYAFSGGADGSNPSAGLAVDSSGNLYGTTSYGGSAKQGTVFMLTKGSGWTESVIHAFTGGKDGSAPEAAPAIVGGEVLGTTPSGGDAACASGSGCGIAFALDPPKTGSSEWTEKILHRFTGGADGDGPVSGLFAGTAGLYGTTLSGGAASDSNGTGHGTAFLLYAAPVARCGSCAAPNKN